MRASELTISPTALERIHDALSLYKALDCLYGSSERQYHTLDHIQDLLVKLGHLRAQKIMLTNSLYQEWELELAILFHDCVYVPGNPNNEEMSADTAIGVLDRIGKSDGPKEKSTYYCGVRSLINATKFDPTGVSYSSSISHAFMKDLDLSILGASSEDYHKYARNIRQEYKRYSNDEFVKGRLEFLRFIGNKAKNHSVFQTQPFSSLNEQVMVNVSREIEALKSEEDASWSFAEMGRVD